MSAPNEARNAGLFTNKPTIPHMSRSFKGTRLKECA
jgi:hypothetical protein